MSLEFLSPINKSHAVQSVVFALEWQGEMTNQALTNIEKLAPQLKSYFPIANAQKMVHINIGAKLNSVSSVQQEDDDQLGGMTFLRTGKFGSVACQLIITRINCVIVINEYERWTPSLDAVMRYLKIVLPAILDEKPIDTIALQYFDVFTWKDDPANLNLREIFTDKSPYLAPNIFDQKGLWHCHSGYVIESFESLEGDCLDNINVSTIDDQGDRKIQISTTHKLTLKKALRLSTKTYLQEIKEIQNVLHEHNKDTLKKLLTDQVCSMISLTNK